VAGAGGEHQTPPPRPPAPSADLVTALELGAMAAPTTAGAPAMSACEDHRTWIEAQLGLGRNATSIYQDLVECHGFAARYNSVKRFVATLRARAPERFDVLEFLPGEEAQVDYGQGAPTRTASGKYKRPYLFVMTLKFSGKSFRCVTWKTNQAVWAQLHEQAFRAFGGTVRYMVLDYVTRHIIELLCPTRICGRRAAMRGVEDAPCHIRPHNAERPVATSL